MSQSASNGGRLAAGGPRHRAGHPLSQSASNGGRLAAFRQKYLPMWCIGLNPRPMAEGWQPDLSRSQTFQSGLNPRPMAEGWQPSPMSCRDSRRRLNPRPMAEGWQPWPLCRRPRFSRLNPRPMAEGWQPLLSNTSRKVRRVSIRVQWRKAGSLGSGNLLCQ